MNIVIAGVGEVGLHVARVLAQDGHHLTVLDSDPAAIERAEETVDALTLRGQADCPVTLREARVAEADLFAALTARGSVNLIACMMAREVGAKRVVARVREQHYFEDYHGVYPGYMGLDLVVNEQAVVARELLRLARAHTASAVETFADHHIELVELPVDEEGAGVNTPIGEINLPEGVLICGLRRRDTVLIPNAGDMVHVGDQIVLVGPTRHMHAAERLFARERRRYNRRTMLVGGGGVGSQVAHALEQEGTEVILIERQKERARALANQLVGAQVLHGDGTDLHLLEENGADRCDVFCAVSGLDEVNLMAALLARDLGCRRCITLVHKPDYVTVCKHLGLENTVSPRLLVAREIIRQLRSGHLLHSALVLGGEALVKEVQVLPGARITGSKLRDLTMPRGAILCAHVSRDNVVLPSPEALLEPGDRLIIFAKQSAVGALDKLMKRPLAT